MIPGTNGYNLIKNVIEYNYPYGSVLNNDININDQINFLWDAKALNYGTCVPVDDFLYLHYNGNVSNIAYYYRIYYDKTLIAVAVFYSCEAKSTEKTIVYRNDNTYFSLIKIIDIKQPEFKEEEIEDIISLLK